MPELPEVKVVCNALTQKVLNKEIQSLNIIKPKLFKEYDSSVFANTLKNKRILKITNKAKYIIFELSDEIILISHLRMEGKYRYLSSQTSEIPRHLMAYFIFSDQTILQYLDSRMFGTFYLRDKRDYLNKLPLSKIAPEVDPLFAKQVFDKIKKSNTAIKTKLLDQTIISGFGNIYIDEALFASKINPLTPCANLTENDLFQILSAGEQIMNESFKKGGTTLFSYESLNNQIGNYQNFLKVHSDKLKFCRTCNTKILKIKVNGRGTYFCPTCQKER
ncbi:DNA-formamidopyrimidine glycosylase [Metamycoplasma equirhinis]|uniref:DNA-formamidopyrimidine glycosylase n=1 Tax=Metamycoplasma equirhinis TaxID=92402 RepID=UPI003593BAD1